MPGAKFPSGLQLYDRYETDRTASAPACTNHESVYTWRTMSQEVTELTVIRIPFQERLQAVKVDDSSAPGAPGTVLPSSEILPFWTNSNRREVSATASPVWRMVRGFKPHRQRATTVPRGFVRTADGSVIYELGRPRSTDKTRFPERHVIGLCSSRPSGSTGGGICGPGRCPMLGGPQERVMETWMRTWSVWVV
jgi:hypothetical protein